MNIRGYIANIVEEIVPFASLSINLSKVMSNFDDDRNKQFASYDKFLSLPLERLTEYMKWEQDRAKMIDEKSNRMTTFVAVSFTVIGLVSGFLPKEVEATGLDVLVKLALFIASTYLLIGGLISLSNARTQPLYGVGLRFISNLKSSKFKKKEIMSAIAHQVMVNNKRGLRNEAAYQSIRNGIFAFFISIEMYVLGKAIASFV